MTDKKNGENVFSPHVDRVYTQLEFINSLSFTEDETAALVTEFNRHHVAVGQILFAAQQRSNSEELFQRLEDEKIFRDVFYDTRRKQFWISSPGMRWIPAEKKALRRFIKYCDVAAGCVNQALQLVVEHNSIDLPGIVAELIENPSEYSRSIDGVRGLVDLHKSLIDMWSPVELLSQELN